MSIGLNYKNFKRDYQLINEIYDENIGKIKIYQNKQTQQKVFEKIRLFKNKEDLNMVLNRIREEIQVGKIKNVCELLLIQELNNCQQLGLQLIGEYIEKSVERKGRIREEELREIVKSVLEGVMKLKEGHGGIKGNSIMIDTDGEFKVYQNRLINEQKTNLNRRAVSYVDQNDTLCDVYAIGMTALALIVQTQLFQIQHQPIQIQFLLNQHQMYYSQHLLDTLMFFVQQHNRPTLSQALALITNYPIHSIPIHNQPYNHQYSQLIKKNISLLSKPKHYQDNNSFSGQVYLQHVQSQDYNLHFNQQKDNNLLQSLPIIDQQNQPVINQQNNQSVFTQQFPSVVIQQQLQPIIKLESFHYNRLPSNFSNQQDQGLKQTQKLSSNKKSSKIINQQFDEQQQIQQFSVKNQLFDEQLQIQQEYLKNQNDELDQRFKKALIQSKKNLTQGQILLKLQNKENQSLQGNTIVKFKNSQVLQDENLQQQNQNQQQSKYSNQQSENNQSQENNQEKKDEKNDNLDISDYTNNSVEF